MDRQIGRWSYWLGIASSVVAILWRFANAFRFVPPSFANREIDIGYLSFLHIGFLLFIVTMATACYSWVNSQK